MPSARQQDETLYVCKIVILRVTDVPVADLHTLSCDPYINATLSVDGISKSEDAMPQLITFRTHTCRRTLNPEFNVPWIVSGIPESGFLLSMNLRDEDPHNYDDNLGKTVVRMPWPDEPEPKLHEGWKSGDREYKVHKRGGSILSKVFTCVAEVLTMGSIGHRVRLWLSVEVLSKAENQDDRRLYTVGPRRYVRHFSPLIGRLLGTSCSPDSFPHSNSTSKATVEPTPAFVANRIQLAGPVPETLRHRYVGFAPFVKAMFRRRGIKGLLLHHTLHKQHLTIYRWDADTVWGYVENGVNEAVCGKEKERVAKIQAYIASESGIEKSETPSHEKEKETGGHDLSDDSIAFAKQFLRMTSYGTHSRIFTYVILLDGEMRFTETGDPLAIEFLSKHTMHSDVEIEIAYSGEFFVRPLRPHRPHDSSGAFTSDSLQSSQRDTHPASASNIHPEHTHVSNHEDGKDAGAADPSNACHPTASADPHDQGPDEAQPAEPCDDPAQYELVIDNDSGTYRPRKDLLPTLHGYLAAPRNFAALGRVSCMDAFDERLVRWKDVRSKARSAEVKGQGPEAGGRPVSFASSRGSQASGLSDVGEAHGDGDGVEGQEGGAGEMKKVVEEDAKRARDNEDEDVGAKEEEKATESTG